MAVMTLTLIDGYVLGDATYQDVGLRELTTEDLIDAQLAAEKVAVVEGKPVAYTSDVIFGLEMLCRQIEYVGKVQGPLSVKELSKFSAADFTLIQQKAQELDAMILQELEARGRP